MTTDGDHGDGIPLGVSIGLGGGAQHFLMHSSGLGGLGGDGAPDYINMGFLGRWGTYACPQCLPSDTVPIRSWTRTLRRPGIRHRHLPYHTIPPYHGGCWSFLLHSALRRLAVVACPYA